MYKLLIVDDEYIVREVIKNAVEWSSYGIELVGEAENGEEALASFATVVPDVVISDLRMPVVDGAGFASAVKAAGYETEVIILSAYQDFEGARKSFESGVFAYLLKPVDGEELLERTLAALKHLTERRYASRLVKYMAGKMSELKQQAIASLLQGGATREEYAQKMEFHSLPVLEEGCVISVDVDKNMDMAEAAIKEVLDLQTHPYLQTLGEEAELVFIVGHVSERVVLLCRDAVTRWTESESGVLSIGVSSGFHGLENVAAAYKEAQSARNAKLFPTISACMMYGVTQKYRPIVVDAIRLIERNYMRDVTVNEAAALLFVSVYHLMHVFKSETNKTFSECLTEYRMYTARRLLVAGGRKISEVSKMVGYGNVKYFSQVFRRENDCTPIEYVRMSRKGRK
ncbi:MAG: response regulator [Clostridiales bacterium]|jgi:two-component system response regulator YesN|nr:response regulator [Clostridiales bacterium]